MEKLSSFQEEVEKFEKLFGYGIFRPIKDRMEVRVKELDLAVQFARHLIKRHSLKLKVLNLNSQLRSFELEFNLS